MSGRSPLAAMSWLRRHMLPALMLGAMSAPAAAEVLERPMPPPPAPEQAPVVVNSEAAPEGGPEATAPQTPVEMSPEATPVSYKSGLFGPDPTYPAGYDAQAQLDVYGGMHDVPTQRPAIEWGYPLFAGGALPAGIPFPGQKDLTRPELLVYGQERTAIAYNDNGPGKRIAEIATRLDLDIDFRITSTERIHVLMRPLDHDGQFVRDEFGGANGTGYHAPINANPVTTFFEGDLGSILAGLTDKYQSFDLPFAFGQMPLFFQNGIWFNDAPIGGGFTIPARNSPLLDISNMDFTFFGFGDHVASGAIVNKAGADDIHGANLIGMAGEVEALRGYIEYGYGYTEDTRLNSNFSYSNVTAAFTKRYYNIVSNSVRVIGNFGQNPDHGAPKTADGYIFLIENSLITPLPITLVPYFNAWFGANKPQPLARDPGTGGVLANTGINFETDALTGFPTLDATGNNTFGGALGVEYLFNLEQQIVGEVATVQTTGPAAQRAAKGDQYAIGLRYQIPINERWIFRADGMASERDNAANVYGIRAEFRWKF